MKKLLVIFMCLVMLVTFSACSGTSFLSKSKVDRLVEKYGEPQMVMTLKYETPTNKTPVTVKVTYDLLLDKTPMTVMNFIKLLADGRYDNLIIDEKNTSNHYFGIGRVRSAEDFSSHSLVETDSTFIGEFKSNNFKPYGKVTDDDDGYTKFDVFTLAMYHDNFSTSITEEDKLQEEYKRAFNSADGRLILPYSKSTLSYQNYAVFAVPVSFEITFGEGEPQVYSGITNTLLTQLTDLTYSKVTLSGTSYTVYKIFVSFEMVEAEGIDWSNVSDSYLIAE